MSSERSLSRYIAVFCLALISAGAAAEEMSEAERIVREAKRNAVNIPHQAQILAGLAWPDGPLTDPPVSAFARAQLVGYGDHGLEAMRRRMLEVDRRYSADIASAIGETRLVVAAGLPSGYLSTFYDALWFGSIDAKRVAMDQLGRRSFIGAMLPGIDAAYDHPELTSAVLRMLPRLGSDKARHYLGKILNAGDPYYTALAAEGLAKIGGRALETLRDATLSGSVAIRRAAIDALIPHSSVDDLTTLYEYVAMYENDDPERVNLVMQRAVQLESLLERAQDEGLGDDR